MNNSTLLELICLISPFISIFELKPISKLDIYQTSSIYLHLMYEVSPYPCIPVSEYSCILMGIWRSVNTGVFYNFRFGRFPLSSRRTRIQGSLSIYLIYPSFLLSFQQSIFSSFYLSILLSFYFSILLSVYSFIFLSIYLFIFPSIYFSIHLSFHPVFNLSFYPAILICAILLVRLCDFIAPQLQFYALVREI